MTLTAESRIARSAGHSSRTCGRRVVARTVGSSDTTARCRIQPNGEVSPNPHDLIAAPAQSVMASYAESLGSGDDTSRVAGARCDLGLSTWIKF